MKDYGTRQGCLLSKHETQHVVFLWACPTTVQKQAPKAIKKHFWNYLLQAAVRRALFIFLFVFLMQLQSENEAL